MELIPYRGLPHPKVTMHIDYKISGESIRFEWFIDGEIQDISWESGNHKQGRYVNGLWNHTCMELFLSPHASSEEYLEFNFSPSGNYAVFAFEKYRTPSVQTEIRNFPSPRINTAATNKQLNMKVEINKMSVLDLYPSAEEGCKWGVTSILNDVKEIKSYWALSHPGKKPDFHLKKSFNLWTQWK